MLVAGTDVLPCVGGGAQQVIVPPEPACGAQVGGPRPFTDQHEVATAYAIVSVGSQDDAVKRASEFLELHQHWPTWEGGSEVSQIFGPGDWHAAKAGVPIWHGGGTPAMRA